VCSKTQNRGQGVTMYQFSRRHLQGASSPRSSLPRPAAPAASTTLPCWLACEVVVTRLADPTATTSARPRRRTLVSPTSATTSRMSAQSHVQSGRVPLRLLRGRSSSRCTRWRATAAVSGRPRRKLAAQHAQGASACQRVPLPHKRLLPVTPATSPKKPRNRASSPPHSLARSSRRPPEACFFGGRMSAAPFTDARARR